jgi:hypothetical protein
VLLHRLYVLFVVESADPPRAPVGHHREPTGAWVAQQARNLLMDLGDRAAQVQVLDSRSRQQFTGIFDAVFASKAIRVLRTLVQAPQAKPVVAYCTFSG